ncbi:MAG: hypothetical protein KUG77_26330, partial [Nannocystaceae bacterium]|nr:hypothetical protein [Nannocystaceae bacterium]
VQMVIGPRLAGFVHRESPLADLRLVTTTAHVIPDELANGTLDAYVGFFDVPSEEASSEVLYDDDFVLLMRSGHGLLCAPDGAPPSVDAWLEQGHVVVSGDARAPTVIDRTLADLGLTRRIAAVVDRAGAVPHLLQETDWVAAVGRHWGVECFARSDGRLGLCEVPIALPCGRIRVVVPRRGESNPRSRWLRTLIHRAVPGVR